MTAFLDDYFSTWRTSPYMTRAYARDKGGAFSKLYIVRTLYRMHLMRPFLAVYRFMIDKLKVDIKW